MASIADIPPNRVVALLTPTVFAPLAGAIAVAAAEYAPGTTIDETSLTAIFIAGATIAFGKAAQWTKGWQEFEKRDAEAPPDDLAFDDETGFEDEADIGDAAEFDDDELAFLEDDDDIDDELMALSVAHEE